MGDNPDITMYDKCLLHSRADRALRVVVGHQLKPFNLSMMEWLLLATVANGPLEGMSMSQVADTLDVTLPQVTALMNDLVKMKLLKQKVSSADRRSRKLMSTLQGKRIVGKIEQSIKKALDEWYADIPNEDLTVYMGTVTKLAAQHNHGH